MPFALLLVQVSLAHGCTISASPQLSKRLAITEPEVRLPDAALGVVRPLLPGCPAKKRLPWPELMEDGKATKPSKVAKRQGGKMSCGAILFEVC